MGEVLGRVINVDADAPRGPDALHRVRVPRRWFDERFTIELELPRNLGCAACEGGGCDRCDRSGAVSVRGRAEPPELVTVTLTSNEGGGPVLVRIPEQGGLAPAGSSLPRGHLYLRIEPSDAAHPSSSVGLSRKVSEAPIEKVPSAAPLAAPRRFPTAWAVAALLALAISLLAWLRFTGR